MADERIHPSATIPPTKDRAFAAGRILVLVGAVLYVAGTLMAFAWDEDFIGRVVDFSFKDWRYVAYEIETAWLPAIVVLLGVLVLWSSTVRRDLAIGLVLGSGVVMFVDRDLFTAIIYWRSPWRIGAPVSFGGAVVVLAGGVMLALSGRQRAGR